MGTSVCPLLPIGFTMRRSRSAPSSSLRREIAMPSSERSRRLGLSRSRRLTIDVLHYHRRMPTCAHDRQCDLSRLAELRSRLVVRISWSLLFIKAFAVVAEKHRVLRQTYIDWPWPHVLEEPDSIAMLATQREYRGEPWLFWSRFMQPARCSLAEMQQSLERFQTEPIKKIFQRQWQLSGFPTFVRRCFWWWILNIAVGKRAERVGTFFLTTLAGKGVEIQDPPAFLTSNLTYGPLDKHGRCRVTISYDHRLMDGSTVADCLIELEQTLNGEIAEELEKMIATNVGTAA